MFREKCVGGANGTGLRYINEEQLADLRIHQCIPANSEEAVSKTGRSQLLSYWRHTGISKSNWWSVASGGSRQRPLACGSEENQRTSNHLRQHGSRILEQDAHPQQRVKFAKNSRKKFQLRSQKLSTTKQRFWLRSVRHRLCHKPRTWRRPEHCYVRQKKSAYTLRSLHEKETFHSISVKEEPSDTRTENDVSRGGRGQIGSSVLFLPKNRISAQIRHVGHDRVYRL